MTRLCIALTAILPVACTFDGGGVGLDDAAGVDAGPVRDGGPADAGRPPDAGPPGTLAVGDVRLTYGEAGVFRVSSQRWNSADRVWEPGPTGAFETGTLLWTANAARGGANAVELVATLGDAPGGDDKLRMLRRDDNAWAVDWTVDVPPSDKRGVDVEFEAGGDAMVVYADGSNVPKYRVRIGETWGAELVVPAPLAGGCPATPGCKVTWVELVSLPGTDKLALGFADTERNLTVILWDGGQWQTTSTMVLETNLKANRVSLEVHNRAFDLAFEELSGSLMVLWGRNGSGMVWWSRYDALAALWSPVAGLDVIAGEAHFVDLATQPGANRIAAGIHDLGDGTERTGAAMWNGTIWVDVIELDGQSRNVNDGALSDWPGAVAWVGDTEQAVLVYSDNKAGEFHWARWGDTRGWALETPVPITGKKQTESVHMVASPAGSVVAAFTDADGSLYAATYNGVSWSVAAAGMPLSIGTSTLDATPFSLSVVKP